ncbi:MAG: phage portal protein [Erysipelotrichia bacterium]|nr:phage portal protein [Erysipelotrichia bacterium]
MSELLGIRELRKKLESKKPRVDLRYRYYDMKNSVMDLGISTPDELRGFNSVLGWCSKAVDRLADRISFREFKDDNFNINEIFNLNNADILFDNAIKSALISSCSFVYISEDESGYPRLQVIDGANATGIIDPITYLLKEGYAVLERDRNDRPVMEAYFEPYRTTIYYKNKAPEAYDHNVGYPLLVPVINRPDAKRPFGRSRITRACMSYMQSAARTIKRSEISAEFYSFPQKWVVGTDPSAERMEKWKASISTLIEISASDEGNDPRLGQFTQQSMQPHNEQLKMFASLFAGETGLTLDDLGFVTDNPSSAEAIAAAHENLRLEARKAQKVFGSCFLNVGFLAACLRDNYNYTREMMFLTKPKYEPVFEPSNSTLSLIGDAAIKINQAVPGYFNEENLRDLTGIEGGS